MNSVHLYQRKRLAEREFRRQVNYSAVTNSKLEALSTLASSIIEEIASLRQNGSVGAMERLDLAEEVRRYEMGLIRSALARAGGNKREAARLLNVKATTLHEKLKRSGMLHSGPLDEGSAATEESDEGADCN